MTSHEIIRSIYHNMPEASLDLLAREMDEVSYPRGTRILKAGSSGYHLQSDDGDDEGGDKEQAQE